MRHVLTDWTQTVEGTVRLRLRLLDRPRSLAVWEETFSGRTNEVVDLERQSLGRLFAVLGIRPTPDESRRIDVLLANNQEAMRLDQAAERLVSDSIGDDALTREALRLAEQALQREPRLHDVDFLAACLMGTTDLDRSPAEVVPPMRRRLEAILEQDPTPIGVLDKLGGIALTHDWNWERYDLYLQRVFVFGTDKFAMLRLCRALWLRTHGYLDEARREQENS